MNKYTYFVFIFQMPKTTRAYKLHKYSNNDLDIALEKIRRGVSYGKVAKEYKIPKSTLFAKFSERIPLNSKKGLRTILSGADENRIKKWILDKARNFPNAL